MSSSKQPLLTLRSLTTRYPLKGGFWGTTIGYAEALRGVDLTIYKGQTLGLVGASGCGKSTLGKTLLRLIEPSSGTITFDGTELTTLAPPAMQAMRRRMQIILQDPYSSLNPRMSIRQILTEPLTLHSLHTTTQAREARLRTLVDMVHLPADALEKYPHAFSGGQRQRISIARALAVEPSFLVLDESVAALDVSVQAQVINLLIDLQEQLSLTYLFISHDLRLVEYIADTVAVMHAGHIVEQGITTTIYQNPQHPYTQTLLAAIPATPPQRQ